MEQVEALIDNEQLVKIRVKGNSMFPFLRHDRDLVTLAYPYAESLRAGRIVMFRFKGRQILHRIVSVRNNIYYIRGDNNRNHAAEYARREDIIGVVTSWKRGGKTVRWDNPRWRLMAFLWVKAHPARVFFYTLRGYGVRIIKKLIGR